MPVELQSESLRESDGRNTRAAWGPLQVLGDRRELTWYHPGSCGSKAELVSAAVLAGTSGWPCRFLGHLVDPMGAVGLEPLWGGLRGAHGLLGSPEPGIHLRAAG